VSTPSAEGRAAVHGATDGAHAPWLEDNAARLSELAPLSPTARVARLDEWARERDLRTESGCRLRFVPVRADSAVTGGGGDHRAYEACIHATGEVLTRVRGRGATHDLYNALMWLQWPLTKARLNALHAAEIAAGGATAPRGRLRDAATVFDENAVLWVGTDVGLEAALRGFDWSGLFVRERQRLQTAVRVRVFGHALLEKLESPFKAITAHAWPMRLAPHTPIGTLDRHLAETFETRVPQPRMLCPLPLLGLPGWCEANRDPAFYNDPAVFRPGRRRAVPASR
jgi:hypothetical protein